MKPARFAYHAPRTLADALAMLAGGGPDARVIAGGQSLVPMMNFRLAAPPVLVDLGGVTTLGSVRIDADGGLVVGATVTMSRLLHAGESAGWPVLRAALRHVAYPQIRNRGTVCGSLAHHDPYAELPAVAVALDAEITVAGQAGERIIPAAEFFVSYYETAVRPGEIVSSVRFPPRPDEGWGFSEFTRKHGDFALVGAVAVANGARLVLFGVDQRPRRIDAETPDAALAVLAALPELIEPMDDVRAGARYRRELAVETSRNALTQAVERAHA